MNCVDAAHMSWILLASISALLSAAAAITQKKVLFRLNAIEFSFAVSVLIVFFSLFIPWIVDIRSISLQTLFIISAKSVLGGFAYLLVMISLERNQISTALPLLGITPAVTALLAFPLLGESLMPWEWIGIALIIAGTYLLERTPAQGNSSSSTKNILSQNHFPIYGAISLFALSSIADKFLVSSNKTDPLIVLFYQHLIYCVLFGVLFVRNRSSFDRKGGLNKSTVLLIILGAVLTIGYRFSQLQATKLAPVALVLAVKRTSILYASFLGGKLFSEERLLVKLFGAILIVAAGFIILRNVG